MKIRRVVCAFVFLAAIPGIAFSAGDPEPAQTASPSFYDQGRVEAKSGNWVRAIELFQKAVEKDANNYKALNMLGFSLRNHGKFREAIRAYDRALAIKPDYAEALEYRGKAFLGAGNRRAALADYQKLVRLGSPLAEDLKEAIDKQAKN